jgi:hypothetical protein
MRFSCRVCATWTVFLRISKPIFPRFFTKYADNVFLPGAGYGAAVTWGRCSNVRIGTIFSAMSTQRSTPVAVRWQYRVASKLSFLNDSNAGFGSDL